MKMDDALPGRMLEKITGLHKATFRAWASDGLLHPTKRKWQGKDENLYDLAEVRSRFVEKGKTSELAKLDSHVGKRVEDVVEVSGERYTTSVDFELISGVVAKARRFLPSPARPPATSAPARPPSVAVPARPPATSAPARPPAPAMGPRAMKRAQDDLGCQKAVVSLLWVTGFVVMALVGAIAKVKGIW